MEKLKGFILDSKRVIEEQNGTLYEYTHERTGAKLLWLSTSDTNKLFSVAFRTTPENDTGVFHILEHSVLNGSAKYPVKEPFVELLKGSMNTFLNAMTFPDKTMYPVSSRNEKDFLNLTSVYLDAVFAPAIYTNPNIFYQEGWHYEHTEKGGDISYKGVVFNEMKGAESTVDTLSENELFALLYPDTCYGYVSGGDPKKIPELSYEQFIDCHRRFYSAANAIFYLEGDMDITKPAEMIEEYLSVAPTGYQPAEIGTQKPETPGTRTREFAIGEDEEEEEMVRISFGKIFGDFSMKERLFATDVLCSYLSDSNEAPLKAAILSEELAQDAYIIIQDGIKQPMLQLRISNTEEERLEAIKAAIRSLRERIAKEGIDKKALEATLNNMEFSIREVKEPRSLYHNILVLNSYLYGGDAALYLTYNDTFRFLREQLDTDYYKELALEMLDIDSMGTVIMLPSKTKGAEDEAEEAERAKAALASWSEAEEDEILELNRVLTGWQAAPDTPEQLGTIPKLELSDVNPEPMKIITTEEKYKEAVILRHPSDVSGITYLSFYFAIPEKYKDKLPLLSIMAELYGQLPTENHTLTELVQDIKMNLGGISADIVGISKVNNIKSCKAYLLVNISVLTSKVAEAKRIMKEILFETDFMSSYVQQNLVQTQNDFRDGIIAGGHRIGLYKAFSGLSATDAVKELTNGITCYYELKNLNDNYTERAKELSELAEIIKEEILCRKNLVCSVTSQNDGENCLYDFIDMFKDGSGTETELKFGMNNNAKTFIKIPSGISYATCAGNTREIIPASGGEWRVAAQAISLEYLWNEVRVKGGAYGTGMMAGISGNVGFYSYRDPGAVGTYEIYKGAGDFLRKFASERGFTGFVISTVSETEPLLSPKAIGTAGDRDYLEGYTYEMKTARRKEMLGTTPEQLCSCADVLDKVSSLQNYCFVGADKGSFEADEEFSL